VRDLAPGPPARATLGQVGRGRHRVSKSKRISGNDLQGGLSQRNAVFRITVVRRVNHEFISCWRCQKDMLLTQDVTDSLRGLKALFCDRLQRLRSELKQTSEPLYHEDNTRLRLQIKHTARRWNDLWWALTTLLVDWCFLTFTTSEKFLRHPSKGFLRRKNVGVATSDVTWRDKGSSKGRLRKMADSTQFELYAISLGLIVPHNLDEFELSRSFLFCFRSASKERLRNCEYRPLSLARRQTAIFEFGV
jgi:hypothetical protein